MTLRVLHGDVAGDAGTGFSAETDDGRALLRELYAPPAVDWLRLNLIAAVSGDAAGEDGTSDTLSNPDDRAVLAAIRDLADGVLVGAASVRAEGYRVPRSSKLVVLTAGGDLGGHRIDPDRADRVVVVCPAAAVDTATATLGPDVARRATVLVVDDVDGRVAPTALVARLRDHGLRSLVCEGGPSLAGQLLHDGLVDELCLSTSPVVIGSGLPVFGRERFDPSRLSLTRLMMDDQSALYARWLVADGPASRR
ncbi:dihydrofolate reductase family protein [Frigoribacterium faeni]|uniref:dihydrofolate reductase family protein n=1 Tax=Frigoribacterium faeni TaxID=145483 RepID=UPI00141BE263|nr:riboflavin biosynthesis pyrimidine reductase [Frigoribacterium faeni]